MLKSLVEQAFELIEQDELTGADAIRFHEIGVSLLNRGYDAQLIFMVTEILIPDWVEFYKGNCLTSTKVHPQFAEFALSVLSHEVEIKPQLPQAYQNRGFVYQLINHDGDALNDYNKAIRLDPSNNDCYFNRALIFERLHRYEDALEDYLQVIKLMPEDHQAHVFAGLLYANTNRFRQALSHFQVAANLGSTEGETLALQLRQILDLRY